MKKIIIGIVSILIVGAIAIALIMNFSRKSNPEVETVNSNSSNENSSNVNSNNENSSNVESERTEQKEGYEVIVSKKDITIEKGSKASFDITFTNPDESSIREYIKCEDQNNIILVSYSMLENKKITVEVEALKVGTTEILVCDYNYPDVKEIVKVNVIEAN